MISDEKRTIIIEIMILKKENEILKRKNKKQIKFGFIDKLFYTILNNISQKVKEFITLIKPETVLKWQNNLIKKFWIFLSERTKAGRPVMLKKSYIELHIRINQPSEQGVKFPRSANTQYRAVPFPHLILVKN